MRQQLIIPLCIIFLAAVAGLYAHYGSSEQLGFYYSTQNCEFRSNQLYIRPIYAQLQRELVKSRLNMDFKLDDLELILNFAQVNSQMGQGRLSVEVKTLLDAVLRAAPTQITALNLLAIDAYKAENFSVAVEYWQRIIDFGDLELRNNPHVEVLRAKIAQTRAKVARFESTPTKNEK